MGYMLSTKHKYEDGINAIDAALDANALFEPQRVGTILPNRTEDDETFTIYREYADGSQVVLNSGVSKNYYSGSYKSLLNTAEAMFPESVTNMQTWNHGAVLVFTQDIDEPYTFADGDEVTRSIMYTASMNSAFPTRAIGFTFRAFCTNQEGQGELQLSQRRSKNHDEMLFSKSQILAEAANRFSLFVSNATMLKGLEMTPSLYRRILDEVAPLVTDPTAHGKKVISAQKRRDGINYFYGVESDTFGKNAFSLYQAVQSYEFHSATSGKFQEFKQAKIVSEPEKNQTLTNRTVEMLLASV